MRSVGLENILREFITLFEGRWGENKHKKNRKDGKRREVIVVVFISRRSQFNIFS